MFFAASDSGQLIIPESTIKSTFYQTMLRKSVKHLNKCETGHDNNIMVTYQQIHQRMSEN